MRGAHTLLAFVVAVAVAASGCISDKSDLEGHDSTDPDAGAGTGHQDEPETEAPTSWSWSAGGHTRADRSGMLQAPGGSASLAVNAGGYGDVTVTVTDANGDVVFERTYGGGGGASDSTTLRGTPGTWTIKVDMDSWAGGFQIDVHGH